MNIITSKAEIKKIIEKLSVVYNTQPSEFINTLHNLILKKKIKFPLLEYASLELVKIIPGKNQTEITDKIVQLDEIGSYVLAGKILQSRITEHYSESFSKACEYIILGDKWYVCDIIGERVMGHGLLTQPEKTIPVLKKLALNENKWIVRSVGVAAHYAAKKSLPQEYCDRVFTLLLSHANTTDFHTKKGIGWGAKTIAKFHPDIIKKYHNEIYSNTNVKQWFKTKIKIGLSYHNKLKDARRNSG